MFEDQPGRSHSHRHRIAYAGAIALSLVSIASFVIMAFGLASQ